MESSRAAAGEGEDVGGGSGGFEGVVEKEEDASSAASVAVETASTKRHASLTTHNRLLLSTHDQTPSAVPRRGSFREGQNKGHQSNSEAFARQKQDLRRGSLAATTAAAAASSKTSQPQHHQGHHQRRGSLKSFASQLLDRTSSLKSYAGRYSNGSKIGGGNKRGSTDSLVLLQSLQQQIVNRVSSAANISLSSSSPVVAERSSFYSAENVSALGTATRPGSFRKPKGPPPAVPDSGAVAGVAVVGTPRTVRRTANKAVESGASMTNKSSSGIAKRSDSGFEAEMPPSTSSSSHDLHIRTVNAQQTAKAQSFHGCFPKVDFDAEYDIVQKIGEGWFSRVYLTEHRQTREEIVLKAINAKTVTADEFLREYQVTLFSRETMEFGASRN